MRHALHRANSTVNRGVQPTVEDKLKALLRKHFPDQLEGDLEAAELIGRIDHLLTTFKHEAEQSKAAHKRAEEAAKSKDLFLAGICHEIRTQMNGIVGILELLLDENDLSDSVRSSLTTMRRSSHTLKRLLNDILDFTQLCAYELKLESRRFSPIKVVDDMIDTYNSNARAKGISLLSMISEHVPDVAIGDETRLRQVLSNLLNNAIKFTEDGRVGIFLTSENLGNGQLELQFEILDTGIGITEEQQRRLFQPFAQAEASTVRKFGGSGLGLLICKNLVKRMGGTIDVESEEGNGTSFQFKVIMQTADTASANDECDSELVTILPRHAITHEAPATKNLRALLAEDNEVNQLVGKMSLERLGYTVDIAEDGNHAIEAARTSPYDVICMDVTMPDIDGLEATRQIRSLDAPSSHARIIAMTGHAHSDDRARCLAAGMDEFISKPFEIAELKEALDRVWALDAQTGESTQNVA